MAVKQFSKFPLPFELVLQFSIRFHRLLLNGLNRTLERFTICRDFRSREHSEAGFWYIDPSARRAVGFLNCAREVWEIKQPFQWLHQRKEM